jgi:bifunctional DNA-binding transcriptional regulator/antitoxin component of YhaV-PrlF toxin-antitoxin module
VRKRLGIKQGDQVEFDTSQPETVIRPVREPQDPFEKWRGALGGFPGGRNEVNAWIREMRGWDKGDA